MTMKITADILKSFIMFNTNDGWSIRPQDISMKRIKMIIIGYIKLAQSYTYLTSYSTL